MKEKYMINDLGEFAISLADNVKDMTLNRLMKEEESLAEEIAAIVRGSAYCSEMKAKKKTEKI